MKEIGGYIELDSYHLPMRHEGAIALNCGRNCLAYLFKSREIKKLKVPYFICNSIISVCEREKIEKDYYHIGMDFKPTEDLKLETDEWLYLVNFYGQLSNEDIRSYVEKYNRVIVDQANGYFEDPISGVDTFYTCRKWFGVPDGAFLYTDLTLSTLFPQDESYDRMRFLLGRFERTASEFYGEYIENNRTFIHEPIKRMSKLTENLLHGINYRDVENRRKDNFTFLAQNLNSINRLQLKPSTFMYPLMVENGTEARKKLQKKKIYIPVLWPMVFEMTSQSDLEYKLAADILPLPIDQRYGLKEMEHLLDEVFEVLEE